MSIDNDIYLTNDKQEEKFEPFFHSLTTHNDNLLMWSHYSDSHKGFCIEYNNMKNSHDEFDMQKVSYQENIPKINTRNVVDNPNLSDSDNIVELHIIIKKFIEAYYIKSQDWKYENEWRLRTNSIYGEINTLICCIFYDTFSKQPEKITEAMDILLKKYADSYEVVKNDEKYKKLRDDFLQKLNSNLSIKKNSELHKVLLNLLSYLYNKQERTFELQDCGLETTAIYLGLEVENNNNENLKNIVRLLKIAQDPKKNLKVYQMQRHKTKFKVETEKNDEMKDKEIDIDIFINKLQAKIDALKNAQTLEKMKKNLQV